MIDEQDIDKLAEIFATREDLKQFATKEDLNQLRVEIMGGQDEIMGKLELLLQEKTIGDAQEKRRAEVLRIHNNALGRGKLLSEQEQVEIRKLQAF